MVGERQQLGVKLRDVFWTMSVDACGLLVPHRLSALRSLPLDLGESLRPPSGTAALRAEARVKASFLP